MTTRLPCIDYDLIYSRCSKELELKVLEFTSLPGVVSIVIGKGRCHELEMKFAKKEELNSTTNNTA